MKTIALIGLGSNLGDRRSILQSALSSMAEVPGIEVLAVSRFHETEPVGGPSGQGPFLNAAARLQVDISPDDLHARLRQIENSAGRVRHQRWGERTLDLDLLLYGSELIDTPSLNVPHPRMAVRRFVIVPLAEIAPESMEVRSGLTIFQLLENLDRRPSLVALDGPDGGLKQELFDRLVAALHATPMRRGPIEAIPPGSSSVADHLDAMAASIEKLDASRWRGRVSADQWIVADFCPFLDDLRADRSRPSSPLGDPLKDDQGQFVVLAAGQRLRLSLERSLSPTFACALPGSVATLASKAKFTPFPLLRFGNAPPELIGDEIIAACHASRTETRVVAS